jgi:hypothetical protein
MYSSWQVGSERARIRATLLYGRLAVGRERAINPETSLAEAFDLSKYV